MKRLVVLAGVVGMLSAPAVQAAMQVTLMDDTSQYSYGNGGEFRAVGNSDLLGALYNLAAYSSSTKGTVGAADVGSWGYSSGLAGQSYFQTFCIETSEEFSPGAAYNVSLSDKAKYGSQGPNGDPISIGTAYLYSQFAKGILSGYNYAYGGGRTTSAGALQQAIWWLEDETGGVKNSFITAAETALGNLTDAQIKADAYGAYGVMALNLGAPGAVQDQLVLVPEPATCVAGALLLLPFGVSTLRVFRKNRRA